MEIEIAAEVRAEIGSEEEAGVRAEEEAGVQVAKESGVEAETDVDTEYLKQDGEKTFDPSFYFYNEKDPKAAQWLRELIRAGALPPGHVDDRCVSSLTAADLSAPHCHFFAGIGGWPLALEMAGWPRDAPVWTASLPCQPFSQAGKQRGTKDERHLWPVFHDLLAQCRPAIVFGEQVASKPGRVWLAAVQDDLEALGYLTAAADLCAAGIGAPHIRQRLYWAAVRPEWRLHREHPSQAADSGDGRGEAGGLAHDNSQRQPQRAQCDRRQEQSRQQTSRGNDVMRCGDIGGLGHPEQLGSGGHTGAGAQAQGGSGLRAVGNSSGSSGPFDSWDDVIYVPCADGKWRPLPARRDEETGAIESCLEPLVNGLPGRVGLLRGYGNAIVPPLAAIFIQSVMESL